MSPYREPRLDEDGSGYLVVADDESGNFTVIQVPTDKPLIAIREALPYFEEHLVEGEKITLLAYPDTEKAIDPDEGVV